MKEAAVLSVAPGSQTVMLRFTDDADDPNDFVSRFGRSTIVGYGREGLVSADSTKRLLTGVAMPGPVFGADYAVISLGCFRPKSGQGDFQFSKGDRALRGRIKILKLLK